MNLSRVFQLTERLEVELALETTPYKLVFLGLTWDTENADYIYGGALGLIFWRWHAWIGVSRLRK